jgi:hypothetical protein
VSGAVWRAIPSIEPHGLDIGGMDWEPPAGGGRDLLDAGYDEVEGLGGQGVMNARGGGFGARNRVSSPTGLISVGRAGNHQPVVVGTYLM